MSKFFRLAAVFSLAAMALHLPAADAPAPIQHEGWLDLNKNGQRDIYEDAAQPREARVADLLARMTFEEKLGQLQQPCRFPDTEAKYTERIQRGEVGSFLDAGQMLEDARQRNALQRVALEQSRLGIPLVFGHDSIHGFRTVFPTPLALSCTWDEALFEQVETISARESSAVGVDWVFAPMVDLARDPRWGRIVEGFGEDPWLGAQFAAACVRGFQGTNVADADRVLACLKHYVGYGATEGGRDYNNTEISEYTLRNFYLPQFHAGVAAGAWTLMSSFNLLNGLPASGSHHTLTEILRDEWKFPGLVVSDWGSVQEMIAHGVAADPAAAATLALNAGVDMEMVTECYRNSVKAQLAAGKISPATLDEAVRRILRVKFAKGLFDRPYTDAALATNAFLRPDAVALARSAAAKACVLLKNDGGILPLKPAVKRLALIGPLADEPGEMLGSWSAPGRGEDAVSLAAGLRATLPSAVQLTVVRGCGLAGLKTVKRTDGTVINDASAAQDDLEAAVAAAQAADVAVLALGEPSGWSGENSARSSLDLPGRQQELFQAVAATGKPVIVVLFNGRPLAIPQIAEKAAAILEAWQGGVQAGNGVADVLLGRAAPVGRLTTSFPRNVGQVPLYYNHYPTGRPALGEYLDGPRTPQYPFGYGLTYTEFGYTKPVVNRAASTSGARVEASVNITNLGQLVGDEVVQVYTRALAASAGARPVRELKGFQRIHLAPGEARAVTFTLTERELGYYNANGAWLVEPGRFQLWIAKDAASGEPVEFDWTAGKAAGLGQ